MCDTCDKKSNHKPKKQKSLKRKRNKCPENDGNKEESPKCPEQKRHPAKAKRCLTRIERIMLRIQPPIADRDRYMNPKHVNCFLEESKRVHIKKPECGPCPSKRRKVCEEGTKKKKQPNKDAEEKPDKIDEETKNKTGTAENKDGDAKSGKENDDGSSTTKQGGEGKTSGEGDKENIGGKKETGKTKKNKRKRTTRKQRKDIEEDSDSEMSIHSNDSEICLVGLGLTKEDEEKIDENRRKFHKPQDNKEKSSQSTKGVGEVTT